MKRRCYKGVYSYSKLKQHIYSSISIISYQQKTKWYDCLRATWHETKLWIIVIVIQLWHLGNSGCFIPPIWTISTCRACCQCPIQALRGLRANFCVQTQTFGPNCNGGWMGCSPLTVLNLMRFIDPSCGPRWAFDTLVLKKTCTLMVCDVPPFRSSPSLGEVLHENQSDLYLWFLIPSCLGSGWSRILLMVFPEGALHVRFHHQVWSLKNKWSGRTYESSMCWVHISV